jgi:peptidoglycan/xylan/chitin deacetylase (PgdA/CDA1 family)
MPSLSTLIGAIALAATSLSAIGSADAAPHILGKRDWFANYAPGTASDFNNCVVSFVDLAFRTFLELRATQNPNHLSLTFDDGTSAWTDATIAALRNASAPGTFFFIGQNVASNPGAAQRVFNAGYEVRLHEPSSKPHI